MASLELLLGMRSVVWLCLEGLFLYSDWYCIKCLSIGRYRLSNFMFLMALRSLDKIKDTVFLIDKG